MSIPVTTPFLPKKEDYLKLVNEIWERNWLTNNGPLVQKLESELKEFLEVPNIKYVSNGTIALQIAYKALNLSGEVITTPFSYVATTSSLVWEGLTPVFCDIDADTFNINPSLIEEKITKKTSAIVVTHVFGNPAKMEEIQKIANKYNLKLIYDAAHCFGVRYNGSSIFNYGDISTTSFHATKIFHTIEGGAIITNSEKTSKKTELLRNFGHDGYEAFNGIGINGKNSEVHAAMGLSIFPYFKTIVQKRKEQYIYYLEKLNQRNLQFQKIEQNTDYNYAYFPIVFESEKQLISSKNRLEKHNIFPRRYFYPSLNTLSHLDYQSCPISESISSRVLCLPLYHTLSFETQEIIVNLLLK